MLLPHNTLVAVADGAHLHLFRNHGTEERLELQPDGAFTAHTLHTDGEHAFVAAMAEKLNRLVLDHKAEHVVVIADKQSLGEMRRHYHKMLEAALLGEIGKDLTHATPHAIEAALHAHKG